MSEKRRINKTEVVEVDARATAIQQTVNLPDVAQGAVPSHPTGLITAEQILPLVQFSRGTLGSRMKDGTIPYIKIGRRVLFDWPSVKAALLRMQRGLN